ncbi:MAG: hypothetical protein IMW96_11955 [Thermoanaerobacteraceae bacterium]|nr:hypothetical protein [Thermoanaerobacteraceae bacterium]
MKRSLALCIWLALAVLMFGFWLPDYIRYERQENYCLQMIPVRQKFDALMNEYRNSLEGLKLAEKLTRENELEIEAKLYKEGFVPGSREWERQKEFFEAISFTKFLELDSRAEDYAKTKLGLEFYPPTMATLNAQLSEARKGKNLSYHTAYRNGIILLALAIVLYGLVRSGNKER